MGPPGPGIVDRARSAGGKAALLWFGGGPDPGGIGVEGVAGRMSATGTGAPGHRVVPTPELHPGAVDYLAEHLETRARPSSGAAPGRNAGAESKSTVLVIV